MPGQFDAFNQLADGGPNKAGGDREEIVQGAVSEHLPELDVDLDEDELLKMADSWQKSYKEYGADIKKQQDLNEDYWLGKHFASVQYKSGKMPVQENRIFADTETFLPIATRQNPEPLISGGGGDDAQKLADKVAKMCMYQADTQKLKLKLRKSMRFWMLYWVGVVKVGWDARRDDIKTTVLRPHKIIFDPNATIDEDGYSGEYLGEYREKKASDLKKMFPKMKKDIDRLSKGKDGTKIRFVEWWTDDFVFWTMDDEKVLLGKMGNPHWNYEEEEPETNVITGEPELDEMGEPIVNTTQLKNHFRAPRKPYIFLSVFSLGKRPHDEANLINQNISTQDLLNKRLRQVDKNVDDMNGGAVVSGDYFTKEEAAQVARAVKKGDTVWQPKGSVNDGYKRTSGQPLPGDVYNSVNDLRGQMDNLFGIHGTTRGERTGPETLGGRILLKGSDVDRISAITENLEQMADDIFNWWVQLIYVYYDEPKVGYILGEDKTEEYFTLARQELNNEVEVEIDGETKTQGIRLLVSVREGSMIPKDPIIRRNEAVDLFKMNPIGS